MPNQEASDTSQTNLGTAMSARNVKRVLISNGEFVVGVPINDFTHHPIVRKLASFVGVKIDSSHLISFSTDNWKKS